MTMTIPFASFVMALAVGVGARAALASDEYRDFADLARHEREGASYRVTARAAPGAPGSRISVLAIHGGGIETGTSEVARAIAGDDLGLYLFEGIKPRDNRKLHITSTHFDEPRGVALAGASRACVSVHGFLEKSREIVCIGGDSGAMTRALAQALKQPGLGVEVLAPCDRFEGVKPGNILQKCQESGAQLELSTALRDALRASPARLGAFARAVRRALGR